MSNNKKISLVLDKKIKKIEDGILAGKINLLNLELVPIFKDLKASLNQLNLSSHSKVYIKACGLLDKKFEELKSLLSSLDNEERFNKYLQSNPSDIEIYALFRECWRGNFELSPLSLRFLQESREKLLDKTFEKYTIEHLEKEKRKGNFVLETPTRKFTEMMNSFYESIVDLLPCTFDEIFQNLDDQIEIYEKFIYILHLLQLKKLKYQNETGTLYI
jgi:hypothetical protein